MGMGMGLLISVGAGLGYWLIYIYTLLGIYWSRVNSGIGNWFLALMAGKADKDWVRCVMLSRMTL